MQEQVVLGKIITGSAKRDAIHIAVAPVVAGCVLSPGQNVRVDENGVAYPENHPTGWIGIVDPFITGPLEKGVRFYLFLYPNTITGMRHHWEHPAFKERD